MVERAPRHAGRHGRPKWSNTLSETNQVGPLICPTRSMIQMDPVHFFPTVTKETVFVARTLKRRGRIILFVLCHVHPVLAPEQLSAFEHT